MFIIKRILGYIGRYRGKAIAAVTLLIFVIFLNMITPLISKSIIDDVIHGGNRKLLPVLLFAMVIISAVKDYPYIFVDISLRRFLKVVCMILEMKCLPIYKVNPLHT